MTLGDLIVRVGANIDGFVSAMSTVTDKMDAAADKIEDRFESIGNVGARFATVGAEMTAAITLPLEEIGRRALETAATFEQTQVAFTTFLGSAGAAQQMLGNLYNFAATTPFEVAGVLQASRTLLAMGFASKDVMPILRTLGDTASGLGVGQAGLERFVFHLGQIRALGHIDGMILREMGQNGVAAAQMIADYMGKSVPEITKMVTAKDPSLNADTVINALMQGMNSQFGGAMKDQMGTLAGQWSNFKDQITLTAVQIGNVLLPAGKALLEIGSEILNWVKDAATWFASLPAPVQGAAIALAAMAAAVGPVLTALGGIGMMLPGIMAALTPLAGALGVSVAALGGWALAIAAALAALAALAVWIATHWEGVRAATSQVFSGIADIWNATLGAAITWVMGKIQAFIDWSSPVWNFFGQAIKEVWQSLKDFVYGIWSGLKKDVIDPMMAFLESIPGIKSGIDKIAGAGTAFDKGEADKKDEDAVKKAESTMHLGANAFKITPQGEAWEEKHKQQLEQYRQALETLRAEHDKGKVSTQELTEAERAYQALLKQKPPKFSAEGAGKEGKVDRNALDALSGIKAHEEAQLALQKAAIEHAYQMNQLSGSDKVGMSEEDITQAEIANGEKRRQALDAIAKKERDAVLENINQKLALYKGDQAGYEKLVAAKTAAEDKYQTELQKNKFAQENIVNKANEEMRAADLKHYAEDLKQRAEHNEAIIRLQKAMEQASQAHLERVRQMEEDKARLRLDLGEISYEQYLAFEQAAVDKAYQMELAAIQKMRAELESMREELGEDEYNSRKEQIDSKQQEITDKHTAETQKISGDKQRNTAQKQDKFFAPIQSAMSSGITSLIEETKTLRQAFADMGKSILNGWIQNMAQMVSQWAVAKLKMLLIHNLTNQQKVASDAAAAAESKQISIQQHMHEVMLAAKSAAAHAFKAVAGIPVIGPILAPIAAAAAFVGVMAFSAERGALLPNENSVVFAHPREMILPRHLSEGIQNLISSGGADLNRTTQVPSGPMSSANLQALRSASGNGDTTHHHDWGGITIHNNSHDPLTPEKVFNAMQKAVRNRNLKMA